MAAHSNVQAIHLPLWFLSFFISSFFVLLSSFFLAYSQWSESGRLPYFHASCGLSANLECRSECAKRCALEIQDAKNDVKSPSAHHRTNLSSYIFASKACIDNRKNVLKLQYLLRTS